MAKRKLFEYAVIYHGKERKDAQGNDTTEDSRVIADVQRVVAVDEKEVAMRAARAIPEEYQNKLDQVEIAIRPF